jgi:hypothetical protein
VRAPPRICLSYLSSDSLLASVSDVFVTPQTLRSRWCAPRERCHIPFILGLGHSLLPIKTSVDPTQPVSDEKGVSSLPIHGRKADAMTKHEWISRWAQHTEQRINDTIPDMFARRDAFLHLR